MRDLFTSSLHDGLPTAMGCCIYRIVVMGFTLEGCRR